jgi:hypothetical protein
MLRTNGGKKKHEGMRISEEIKKARKQGRKQGRKG